MTQTKIVASLGVVLVLAGLSAIMIQGLGSNSHRMSGPQHEEASEAGTGGPAAEFSLTDLKGQTVKLSALRGKVVFLNVWATWCGPCQDEMPSMEALYEKLKNKPDFVMLAVSEDRNGRDAVAPFVAKYGFRFNVLLDPENRVGEDYNITGLPETFIIDRQGRIVAHHLGAFDWSGTDIQQALLELLKTKES